MSPPNAPGLALHLEGVVTSRVACLVTCTFVGNFFPLIPVNQKAFYNLSVATLGLKSVQLRVNYNKTALVISNAPIVPNFIKTLQVAANSPTITIDPINKTKIPVPRLPSKNPRSRWSSATSPKTSPPRRSQPSALQC
jgi:hypothetical protein